MEIRMDLRDLPRPAASPEPEEPLLIRYLREALERLPASEPPPIPSPRGRVERAHQARFHQD
jgi:hypothetical protein